LLACLFLGTLRVSEVAQLQRRDVKRSRGVIQIPASKTAAGIARDSFPAKQREDGTRVTHVPSHAGRRTAITWWGEAGTRPS
jgi:integrase